MAWEATSFTGLSRSRSWPSDFPDISITRWDRLDHRAGEEGMVMRRFALVLVTCLALIVTSAPVVAAPPDNPAGLQRVIVQLRADFPTPRGLATQAVAGSGGRIGAAYEHALKGFAAELPWRLSTPCFATPTSSPSHRTGSSQSPVRISPPASTGSKPTWLRPTALPS